MTKAETLNNNYKLITMKKSEATIEMLSFINRTIKSDGTSFDSKRDASQLLINYVKAVRGY